MRRPALNEFLQKHFFQPTAAQSLSLFRFLYCSFLIWRILCDGPALSSNYGSVTWNPIPLFEKFGIPLMSAEAFTAWRYLLVTALALTALGVYTRVSVTAAWIAYFVYIGTYLGFTKSAGTDYVYHSKNIVIFVLMILSIAPGIGLWGFDGWRERGRKWRLVDSSQAYVSAWPIQLIKLTLGLAYFGAGYCKVAMSPFWADGETLQAYLVGKYLLLDTQNAIWLAGHFWLCFVAGVATLLLELTFFVIVFFPRLTWPYVIGGLCFHLGIYFAMEINFFPYFGLVYLIFLDWSTFSRMTDPVRALGVWIRTMRSGARQITTQTNAAGRILPAGPMGDTRFARSVVLGLTFVLVYCVMEGVEKWPFTDYRVFRGRQQISKTWVFRMAGVTPAGERRFLDLDEYPMGGKLGWWITYRRLRDYRDLPEAQDEAVSQVVEHLTKHAPGRYEAVVVVRRSVAGVPGAEGFRVIDQEVLRRPVTAEVHTAPVHRIVVSDSVRKTE